MQGLEGGEVNASTPVVEESITNIGATVMGRNMFGGHPGPWAAKDPCSPGADLRAVSSTCDRGAGAA
jgi:hypothetical protein